MLQRVAEKLCANALCALNDELRISSLLKCALGWLRLVGSLKLRREYILFYGALLQKRPVILSSILIVATPIYAMSCFQKCVPQPIADRVAQHLEIVSKERLARCSSVLCAMCNVLVAKMRAAANCRKSGRES